MEIEKKLTAEDLELMKDFAAIDFETSFKWVPLHFRQKDKQGKYKIPSRLWPVFQISLLNGIEKSDIEDEMTASVIRRSDGGMETKATPGSWRLMILKNHVKGWSNFRNRKGDIVNFDKTVHLDNDGNLNNTSLSLMNEDLQDDLARAISSHLMLNDEELRGLE